MVNLIKNYTILGGLMEFIKNFFKFAFDFVGVTKRTEYWLTIACVVAAQLGLIALSLVHWVVQLIAIIILLLLMVPTLSLSARRLHDTDRSAFNLFWLCLPVIGAVILIIYLTEKTKYFVE